MKNETWNYKTVFCETGQDFITIKTSSRGREIIICDNLSGSKCPVKESKELGTESKIKFTKCEKVSSGIRRLTKRIVKLR
jgi:hypothetical protein